jgi:hypothetical protein
LDALDVLRDLVAQQAAIERALIAEVARLRYDRYSWTQIGRALRVSRQGARQRYERHVARGAASGDGQASGRD